MDCHKIKEHLFSYLDGELVEEVEHFEIHLEKCLPCFQRVTIERAFLKVVKAKAVGRPVPGSLEERIRAEISNRKDASGRRIPYWALAAAAVLVTAVGLALVPWSDSAVTPSASKAALGSAPGAAASPVAYTLNSGATAGTIEGTLVCIGCTVACSPSKVVDHIHRNGIRANDGRIWHILETDSSRSVLMSADHRGKPIRVEGQMYPPAQVVSITSYQF